MRIWGCPTCVKRTKSNKMKIKSNKCLFVRYPKGSIVYQVYNTLEQSLFVSKHTVFLEKEFILRDESRSKFELSEVKSA